LSAASPESANLYVPGWAEPSSLPLAYGGRPSARRGTNENANGLLRLYFPKGTDLSRHSRTELDAVAFTLKRGSRFIRVVLLCVVIALVVKLAYDQFA
jgi:hypothetical protein